MESAGPQLEKMESNDSTPVEPSGGQMMVTSDNGRSPSGQSPARLAELPKSPRAIPPRVRLITMAWGERYIEELFSLTLPAVLAPNNLPALAAHFSCELIILTEENWFPRLQQEPVLRQLKRLCSVEFRPLDDLISQPDAYGMALTYALFRGFEDLGAAMVDMPLIFFNADFILADGSLKTVAEKLLAGERLILAPSYCVTAETVMPWLASRRSEQADSIAVPPREMAEVAIRNRHNTIRGKTVNQRVFSVEWMDQFYWLVDEQTLIAHQMPFAVVAMQPERMVTEMRTFWDYGIISEVCPNAPRCVIADSDDYLMIELRSADTARGQLCLGWPEPKQIAEKLARFTTKDPIELARYTLILHSGELPDEIGDAKTQLDDFVQAVLAELPEPIHWVNHPIWAYHYPAFHQAREAFLGRGARKGTGSDLAATFQRSPGEAMSRGLDDRGSGRRLRAAARQLYYKHFGKAPWLRPLHPRWADAQPVVNILKKLPDARILVVTSKSLQERLFGNLEARQISVPDLDGTANQPKLLEGSALRLLGSQIRRLRIAGDHEFDVEVVLTGRTTAENVRARSVELVLTRHDQPFTWPEAGQLCAGVPDPGEKYEFCILELNADDLLGLTPLLSQVARWVEPGGKILVFHLNTIGTALATQSFIGSDAFWLDMPCRIHFAGSPPSLKAVKAFYRGIDGLRSRRLVPAAKGLARVSTACLAALRTSKSELIHSGRAPSVFTSFTLEIDVSTAAGDKAAHTEAAQAAD
jgi:hypothetical protein